jgi:hypothetical protein
MVTVVYGLGQLLESFVLTPRSGRRERIGLHPVGCNFCPDGFWSSVGFCRRPDCPAAECSFVGGNSTFAHCLHRQVRFTRNDQFMMQQLVLDMGHGPAARRWQTSVSGPNLASTATSAAMAWARRSKPLEIAGANLFVGRQQQRQNPLAKGGRRADLPLLAQTALAGLTATALQPVEFDEHWSAVLMDDVHLL